MASYKAKLWTILAGLVLSLGMEAALQAHLAIQPGATGHQRKSPGGPERSIENPAHIQIESSDLELYKRALEQAVEAKLPPESALPIFERLLEVSKRSDIDGQFRLSVVRIIARYGAVARDLAPELTLLLNSAGENVELKAAAAEALVDVLPGSAKVMDTLLGYLHSPRPSPIVMAAVADAVGRLGLHDQAIVTSLNSLLAFPDAELQYVAFRSLGLVSESVNEPSVNTLNDLESVSPQQASRWFLSQKRLGVAACKVAPLLGQIIAHSGPSYMRLAAMDTLPQVEPMTSGGSTKALLAAAEEMDPVIAESASNMLTSTLRLSNAVAPELIKGMYDPNPRVRDASAGALLKLEQLPAGHAVMSALIAALRKPGTGGTSRSLRAYLDLVTRVGTKAGPYRGVIKMALLTQLVMRSHTKISDARARSDNDRCMAYLLGCLQRIQMPKGALEVVLSGLRSDSPSLLAAAARSAGILGTRGVRAVPGLIALVRPGQPDVLLDESFAPLDPNATEPAVEVPLTPRLEAIRALGKIGKGAGAAVSVLRTIARSAAADPIGNETAVEATAALAVIGDRTRPILPRESVILKPNSPSAINRVVSDVMVAEGKRRLRDYGGSLLLIMFADTRCHVVVSVGGRIQQLYKRYRNRGLKILYVFPGTEHNDSVSEYMLRNGYDWQSVRDVGQQLARTLNARVSSECFLLDSRAVLRYHGRVDDSVLDPTSVKRRELADAVQALLSGRPVAIPETQAVGCTLPVWTKGHR